MHVVVIAVIAIVIDEELVAACDVGLNIVVVALKVKLVAAVKLIAAIYVWLHGLDCCG